MKAYQLKITIKNSKPPIWRRCIIPAGITFTQLSTILNEIMGWYGHHLFSFEFYHRELEITENIENNKDTIPDSKYNFAEASTTYINEYMESEEWFTYTYDFGDNWQHRVTIEEIIPDYEDTYPQVIKHKGDCPFEDCGGIDGYYHQLEILADPSHPEHETMKDDLKAQLDVRTYDIKERNKTLKKYYQITYGEGENRTQEQLREAQSDGELGFHASTTGENAEKSALHNTSDLIQKMAGAMNDMIAEKNISNNDSHLTNKTLASVLESYTKEDLMDYVELYEIKGVAKSKKKELIDKIVTNMLDEDIMTSYFSCLSDDEIKVFESLANGEDNQEFEQELYLMKLYEAGYVDCLKNDIYIVPEDVKTTYQKINTPKFQQERKRKSLVLACMKIAGALYGVFSFSTLSEMCEHACNDKANANQWSNHQIQSDVSEIPGYLNDFVITDNQIIAADLYNSKSYRELLKIQEDKKFYLPTIQEIQEFAIYTYFPSDTYLLKLEQYLKSIAGNKPVEMICLMAQKMIICGRQTSEVYEMLKAELRFANMKQLKEVIDKVTDMWNHTRMITNRGYTPAELQLSIGKPQQHSNNAVNANNLKKDKIYPNDACPCESGKKYKRCCGKHKLG